MSHPKPLPFTKLDEAKLAFYQKQFGPLSCEEALSMAILADGICEDLPPLDVAKQHFLQERAQMLEYSVLLEKQKVSSQDPT